MDQLEDIEAAHEVKVMESVDGAAKESAGSGFAAVPLEASASGTTLCAGSAAAASDEAVNRAKANEGLPFSGEELVLDAASEPPVPMSLRPTSTRPWAVAADEPAADEFAPSQVP